MQATELNMSQPTDHMATVDLIQCLSLRTYLESLMPLFTRRNELKSEGTNKKMSPEIKELIIVNN